MNYRFHPEALEEYDQAADYYKKRKRGLEKRFLAAVEAAIDRISETPEKWRKFDGDVRRYLVHVFPYIVLYSVEPEGFIYIIAVMHARREPGYWKQRLRA